MWLNILLNEMALAGLWLGTAQGINGLFALLCVAAALGADGRRVMALSAVLYLALMLI
ncbi:MAG: hypothetical protein ACRC6I_17560 [Paracoccaceae bacterium]